MSRQALYRKYRPADLAGVVGQEHITKLLEAAVAREKISHAYLFTGPRGTGKTSVARILARTVNQLSAEQSLDNELDIIEIDAASNRGIDEIRSLREKISTAPTRLKYKVFIIDEAHMLTREAFNALLKTLEEPPAHVIFVLATTEVHKLPDTVISRTQRYDFRPVRPEHMLSHLQFVSSEEKIDIDDAALSLIAELSGGGFRDALSLLDQMCVLDTTITRESVAQLAGIGDEGLLRAMLTQASTGNTDAALATLGELWEKGAEPTLLNEHILIIARQAFLYGASKEWGIERPALARILTEFSTAARELKTTPLPVLPLELALWRLSQDITQSAAPTPVSRPANVKPATVQVARPTAPVEATVPGEALSSERVTAKALSLIKTRNNSLYAVLRSGEPVLSGGNVVVRCRFRFHKERIEETKNRQLIEAIFTKVADRPIELVVEHAGAVPSEAAPQPEEELVASALEILGGEVVEE